ncbi:MAG: DUF924 family protein [Leptolyngbya sp. IPPAS B-1204]|nr:DUF924 domain-containing protein [Elainella sp. C42_A2020_010]RNJ70206.1 MAG: DUF924 domain-containing protein [Leptolyngbya sp. IPPAS B-1204]
MDHDSQIQAVLSFWFGDPPEAASYAQRRKFWFGKQPEFDAEIRQKFAAIYEQAAAGALDAWQQLPAGCLALVIVLDQFSRNMFRDTPQAFATDAKALQIAQQAVAQGFDQQLAPIQRIFLYLPFEHSENLADQHQSVELTRQLSAEVPELADVFDYAVRHQDVIERFGRFPHRNRILGRESTPEEIEFLKQPGSSF